MQPIKDLINRIKWDKSLKPEEYTLTYIDFGKEKEIPHTKIKKLEGNFMILENAEIPLHRIRKVKRQGKLIWKR